MFAGKTALITGSTSGIGLGIAREFAARGANIVLNGFGDAAHIAQLRQELAQEECPISQINERLGVLLGLKGG